MYLQSKEAIEHRKARARHAYSRLTEEEMEVDSQEFYTPAIMFPIRPSWNRNLSRSQLEKQENDYFRVSFS